MSAALVVMLGLWALGAVASAWVWVLVRMLRERRDADQRAREDRWWASVKWVGDTVPDRGF